MAILEGQAPAVGHCRQGLKTGQGTRAVTQRSKSQVSLIVCICPLQQPDYLSCCLIIKRQGLI